MRNNLHIKEVGKSPSFRSEGFFYSLFWHFRLTVRTHASHAWNTSSILVGAAKKPLQVLTLRIYQVYIISQTFIYNVLIGFIMPKLSNYISINTAKSLHMLCVFMCVYVHFCFTACFTNILKLFYQL